jgi:aldehyde dehydrogenase (NAD+)
MQTSMNFIGGKWLGSATGKTFSDVNPANTDHVVAVLQDSGPEDVAQAVSAAQVAFPGWANTPAPRRGGYLLKAAHLIEQRADDLARLLTQEEGKTLPESKGEVMRAVRIFEYFGGEGARLTGETVPSERDGVFAMTVRQPLGVVALITPWNFPIAIPAWKLGPALVSGNTVVIKPASLAPMLTLKLAEALAEAGLPDGVLNVVTGSGRHVGMPLVSDPSVKAVSFTGSVAVGDEIYAATAKRKVRTQLEMGGKNPTIVLADADLALAAAVTANAAFMSAGEKCTATSRVIVERSVLKQFTSLIVEEARKIRVGDPMDPSTAMGPAVDAAQLKTDLDYIEIAKAEGARLLCGGNRLTGGIYDKGFYVEPTIFADVQPHMRIAQEEVFGPVLGIMAAEDFDDAIRIANDIRFGLSASLCTKDISRMLQYIHRIEAGTLMINLPSAGIEYQVPFGGMKASSTGFREQGSVACDFYTQIKTVYVKY